jgi:hypothetical protein
VVADSGYANGEQAQACEKAGTTVAASRAQTVNPKNPGLITREAFTYDAGSDSYACPAGETLGLHKVSRTEQKKYYAAKACAGCALKPRCTKAKRRTIARGFYEEAKEAMHKRAPAIRS